MGTDIHTWLKDRESEAAQQFTPHRNTGGDELLMSYAFCWLHAHVAVLPTLTWSKVIKPEGSHQLIQHTVLCKHSIKIAFRGRGNDTFAHVGWLHEEGTIGAAW